ncbi:MAG: hypothetical protein JRM82_04160 [Nitrososphaerota archaeon]|nr:hypothetical protein [Nitrososphaerota archaeon]
MLAQEIASLSSEATGPPTFAFDDLTEALHLGKELARLTGGPKKAEFYLSFNKRISLEEMHALKDLASAGISIVWDPNVTRSIALIGGIKYSLQRDGLRNLGSTGAYFSKAGFFGVMQARITRAQRLEEESGLAAVLILEREGGERLPLFVAQGMLPHGLRLRDTVEAAYLSVVGERTIEGGDAPAEVFVEALAIELLHTSPSHTPLAWVSAHEEIDRALSAFEQPPAGGSKKVEAWQKAARSAVTSALRKETIYVGAGDERYIYAEIGRRAEAIRKRPEPHHKVR